MKCSFCPNVDPQFLTYDSFICCRECYALLVIRYEFQPLTEKET